MIKTLYPCFQHWSARGSVYLISDTHFGDSDREFMGYDISEKEQIALLNFQIRPGDTLIHLGDVGNAERLIEIKYWPRIYRVLITGNHDTGETKTWFNEVYTGPVMISDKLILSHEPVCLDAGVWRTPIAFNIHGHDHSGEYYDDYHLNIAQNVWGYLPLNLKEFINDGVLKDIQNVHRITIDRATTKNSKK